MPMSRPHVHKITPREQEVLELVALGLTNMEIGRKLCISERTARAHVTQILSKMRLGNRTELARYVWQQDLKPADDVLKAIDRLVCTVRQIDNHGLLRDEVETADQWVKGWDTK